MNFDLKKQKAIEKLQRLLRASEELSMLVKF